MALLKVTLCQIEMILQHGTIESYTMSNRNDFTAWHY